MSHMSHSLVSLHVLGCGGVGSPRCLYVATSTKSYLFNCSEGTQRIAFEYHYRLAKTSDIFVTTPVWSNFGGLPGLALTVEKAGRTDITVHGPDGTSALLDAIKNFVTLKTLTVKTPESHLADSGNREFTDANMRVEYVSLARKQAPVDQQDIPEDALVLDDINYYDYQAKGADGSIESGVESPVNANNKRGSTDSLTGAGKKLRKLEINVQKGRISESMAYICKIHDKPGILDVERCKARGVSPGPLFGKLKNGEDVVLEDGRLIKSREVCSPPAPGPVFIVIDCYDEDVLDSLIANKSFDKHFHESAKHKYDIPYCIVHFTPEAVLQNPRYQLWMSKFGKSTINLVINDRNNAISSEGIHLFQRQLHLLDCNIFPILADEYNEVPGEVDPYNLPQENRITVIRAKNNDAIHLRPMSGFDNRPILKSSLNDKVKQVHDEDDGTFHEAMDSFFNKLDALGVDKCCSAIEKYPKLTMLGTGSSIPSKTRNTSGILLQFSEKASMIMDCGEATVGQMFRLFGKVKCSEILSTVKVVYISHLHADHHIGLIGFLHERHKVTKSPVYLLAPEQINGWMQFYNATFEEVTKYYELLPNHHFLMQKNDEPNPGKEKVKSDLQIKDINTIFVKHCAYAYGISIILNDDRKIVYSGDTMPSENLVSLGKDCDLLIHEATHDDDMEAEASMKRHSTLSQAIEVGQKMNAKHVLLTHFSQRYAKIPRIVKDVNLSNVGFAYDNMKITFSQLKILPLFYPVLKVMFSEFCKELDAKAEKQQKRTLALQAEIS